MESRLFYCLPNKDMYLDRDLIFLNKATNDDLLVLCDIITKENDGTYRTTETLSSTRSYIRNYPDNIKRILPELVHEFRLFGGNSVLNFFRGEGPGYSEILRDVANKCKVSFNDATSKDEHVEQMLLGKLIKEVLDNASDSELRQMMRELDLQIPHYNRRRVMLDLEKLWKSHDIAGFRLLTSVTSTVLTRLTGIAISTVAGITLPRLTAVMLGPIGLILTSLYCAIDFAGPAYRVTIPAVIQIAYIRQKMKFNLKQ